MFNPLQWLPIAAGIYQPKLLFSGATWLGDHRHYYVRVFNYCIVVGATDVTLSATTDVIVSFSVPIPPVNNFSDSDDALGVGMTFANVGNHNDSAEVFASVGAKDIHCRVQTTTASAAGTLGFRYMAIYRIDPTKP